VKHGYGGRVPGSASQTKTYRAWCDMLSRCRNPRNPSYPRYGGRGVGYDPRWEVFTVFLEEMGTAPRGLTLERIDNSRGYSKANCRWASWAEQARNHRSTVHLTHQGVTLCVSDWAARLGINIKTLRWRLWHGWSTEKALSLPVTKQAWRAQ